MFVRFPECPVHYIHIRAVLCYESFVAKMRMSQFIGNVIDICVFFGAGLEYYSLQIAIFYQCVVYLSVDSD